MKNIFDDDLQKLFEETDISHIKNDDQLCVEIEKILAQVNSGCLEIQKYIDEILK